MWLKTEPLYELEIFATVNPSCGKHVIGNGRIRTALECALAVVAEYATPACETDERLRIDETIYGYNAAEFVVRELGQVFVRGAGNRVQHIHRSRLDSEFAEVEAHIDAVFHRLAKAHDASAANFETCGQRVLQGSNLVVVGVRCAHVGEVPAISFQVVVEAGETGFFQLVELFPVQEPCRKAYGKFRLFFEAANGLANLFHVAVRKRAARSDDGVARDTCGFFLLCVSHDFVGAEQFVFGGSGMVVTALSAVLTVFGAASAAGVHDGTEIKVVAVELFADFVCCGAEFAKSWIASSRLIS